MIILSSGKDWIRILTDGWRYEYTGMNPYQIRKVRQYQKNGFFGKAWAILRKYPFTKETIDSYRRSCTGAVLVL